MSNLFNQPWTTTEKIALLTNILQGAYPDLQAYLMHLIVENNINPKWNDIALPPGRTLHACQYIFEEISRLSQQRRSFSTVAPFSYIPAATITPTLSNKRSFVEQEPVQPIQRVLQPRPPGSTGSPVPTTNGESLMLVRTFGPDTGSERRKKRGRPTKEEAEERDRALAAEGKVYEPKKRPVKKARPSLDIPIVIPSEAGTATSPTLQTPLQQTSEPREDSSSGKRRSKRQEDQHARQETQAEPSTPTSRVGSSSSHNAAQSPSDRLLARYSERDTTTIHTSLPPTAGSGGGSDVAS